MPECPKCDDTGWIVVERDGISGAERCGCIFDNRSRRLEDTAGIPPLYRDASLDNFKLPDENPIVRRELARVVLMVKGFINNFPNGQQPGLLLIGEPGTGKTHLAVAALRRLIAQGHEGIFFDYQNLLDRIRASYDQASGASDREAYRAALDSEVLMLDDLGAHRVTDWVQDIVTSVITYRCNNQKALIATTNLPDPEAGSGIGERPPVPGKIEYRESLADKIGARARSRLFEMCKVVRMPLMEDFRMRKQRSV